MHQRSEGRVHDGQQDRGEAGLDARQDRKAGRDMRNPGRISPERLAKRQPAWNQRGR